MITDIVIIWVTHAWSYSSSMHICIHVYWSWLKLPNSIYYGSWEVHFFGPFPLVLIHIPRRQSAIVADQWVCMRTFYYWKWWCLSLIGCGYRVLAQLRIYKYVATPTMITILALSIVGGSRRWLVTVGMHVFERRRSKKKCTSLFPYSIYIYAGNLYIFAGSLLICVCLYW